MEAEDLPRVLQIDALCLPRPWSAAIWRGELGSPFGLYLVVEERGEISGHIGVRYILGELHITTIAVIPEHRRRGQARALIGAALAAYPNADHVHLEVRPTNAAAIALYEKLLPASLQLLRMVEKLKQQQCWRQAGQERDEDTARDHGVDRTPD